MDYVPGLSITGMPTSGSLVFEQRLSCSSRSVRVSTHAHCRKAPHPPGFKPSNILISPRAGRSRRSSTRRRHGTANAQSSPTRRVSGWGTPDSAASSNSTLAGAGTSTSGLTSIRWAWFSTNSGSALVFDGERFGQPERLRFGDHSLRKRRPCPAPAYPKWQSARRSPANAEPRWRRWSAASIKNWRIPMKAMRKDRTCRYRSASELPMTSRTT